MSGWMFMVSDLNDQTNIMGYPVKFELQMVCEPSLQMFTLALVISKYSTTNNVKTFPYTKDKRIGLLGVIDYQLKLCD